MINLTLTSTDQTNLTLISMTILSTLTSTDHDLKSLWGAVYFVYAHCPHANILHEHVHLLPEREHHICREISKWSWITLIVMEGVLSLVHDCFFFGLQYVHVFVYVCVP